MVILSLLAKTQTSAERFCNKDYSLHSSFTHTRDFFCPPEYPDWGYLIFFQDVYIYTWNPRGGRDKLLDVYVVFHHPVSFLSFIDGWVAGLFLLSKIRGG